MLTIHLHTGHEKTIDDFINSMEGSGYALAGRVKNFLMPSSTLQFRRASWWSAS